MKCKIFKLIIGLTIQLLFNISTHAQTVVTINGIHYIIENNEAVIGRQDKNLSGNIIIPNSIEYEGHVYNVKRIIGPIDTYSYGGLSSISANEAAFQETEITSIELPSTITSISSCAFINCSKLQKVVLPETLTSIGWGAFAYCSSLTEINLPSSLQNLSAWSFGGCSSLKKIEIPQSITVFPDAVFKGCGVEEFDIPAHITRLGRESLNMYSLKKIKSYIRDITRIYCHDDCFGSVTGKTLCVPKGSKFIYQEYNPWRKFASIEEFDDGHVGEPINPREIIATVEDIRYTLYEDGTAKLTQQDETLSGDIVIPETIKVGGKEYTITGIKEPNDTQSWGGLNSISADGAAFQGTLITSVVLPSTITSISSCAFINCSKLQKVVLPETLISIGWGAFAYCSSLTEINLPNSLKQLSAWCLAGCTALKEISIPRQITNLPSACFKNSGLIHFEIHENIKTLNNLCLNISTLKKVKIYQTQNEYLQTSENAFGAYDNVSNTDLLVPKGCKSLYLQLYPWMNFHSIEEFGHLINLDFNEGGELSASKTIALNESDEIIIAITPKIGFSLKKFTVNNLDVTNDIINNEYVLRDITEDINIIATFEINSYSLKYIVDGDEYKSISVNYGTLITPEPEPTKEGFTFSGWSEIPETMPAHDVTITGIFNIVFADDVVEALCLTNWDTDKDGRLSKDEAAAVTALGSVFSENTNITTFDELQYFTGLTSIGERAFYYSSNLTSVSIPNTVKTIGNRAFYVCSGLTSLHISANVTSIEDRAFAYCSGLESIEVEAGNKVYDSRNNCNALIKTSTHTLLIGCKNTEIPSSVKVIADGAFRGCAELTSIEIPEGVTTISSSAFRGCTGLTSVTLPSTITSIGTYAFSAFDQVYNLTTVTVNMTTPVTISSNVFSNRANSTLYVPKGRTDLYKAANYWKEFKVIKEIGDYDFTDVSQMANAIYMDEKPVIPGNRYVLPIKLKNDQLIMGYQFDLELPEGVNFALDDNGKVIATMSERGVGFSIGKQKRSDRVYRFVVISANNNILTGEDGVVMNVSVDIADDLAAGTYGIVFKNGELTAKVDDAIEAIKLQNVFAAMKVVDVPMGDVNGDGSVSVTDVVSIINYILGNHVANFQEVAADANCDGTIAITDVVSLINIILNDDSYAKQSVMFEE